VIQAKLTCKYVNEAESHQILQIFLEYEKRFLRNTSSGSTVVSIDHTAPIGLLSDGHWYIFEVIYININSFCLQFNSETWQCFEHHFHYVTLHYT